MAQAQAQRFLDAAGIISALFLPNDEILEEVESFQLKVGWGPNSSVVGLHLRGGDSCTQKETFRTRRVCDEIDAFIPDLRRIHEMYGIMNVFVATDELDKVIAAARRFPEFNWWFSYENARYAGDGRRVEGREGQAYVRDVVLMSKADVLLGKFTSNLERLALELRAGRDGILPAFVSHDAAWCFGVGSVQLGPFNGTTFKC